MTAAQKFGLVVVAAGRGERAGSPQDGPKQYRPVGGRAVIAHTLATFLAHPDLGEAVVVIHKDDADLFAAATADLSDADRLRTVVGGATRQASVRAGLEALAAAAPRHVLIHDAVRPFVTRAIIDDVLDTLRAGHPAALPAVAVADTLKRGDAQGAVAGTVPRTGLYAAQTPQGFDYSLVAGAHARAAADSEAEFTDDCAIAEWAGLTVRLSAGHPSNVKLTTAEDIAMANDKLMPSGLPDVRTGNGYDVHRLVPGTSVTLCGIEIPHDQRLDGHSDADVGLHALTDALLATCGAGDIGDHFPPSDPQWRGAASDQFLAHAAGVVRAAGGVIMNADVTLIAEAPKIGPHRQAMRAALARTLGISIDRCSVKATTNETIGFAGRREGIAAIATASVIYGTVR